MTDIQKYALTVIITLITVVLNLSINDIQYSHRLGQEFQSLLHPLHSSHQNKVSVISINEG